MQNNGIQTTKEKRLLLKAISAPYKMLVQQGAINTINEALIESYTNEQHQHFKSYRGWLAEGFQVKKGEKAFLIWGTPQPLKSKSKEPTEEEKENSFFPLAYIFSNSQVERRRTNEN